MNSGDQLQRQLLSAQAAAQERPIDPLVWRALASVCAAAGDPATAYRCYSRAILQAQKVGQVGGTITPGTHASLVQQLVMERVTVLRALCAGQGPAADARLRAASNRQLPLPTRAHVSKPSSISTVSCSVSVDTSRAGSASASSGADAQARVHAARRAHPRVLVLSDLHVDQSDNLALLSRLSGTAFKHDILIVAGDVGDSMAAVKAGLSLLRERFGTVFFTPGNHDLWRRPGPEQTHYPDSVCKLLALQELCDKLHVCSVPKEVQPGLWLVPLMSWHTCTFDVGDPRPGPYLYDSFCEWPVEESGVADMMLRMNSRHLAHIRTALETKQQALKAAEDPHCKDGSLNKLADSFGGLSVSVHGGVHSGAAGVRTLNSAAAYADAAAALVAQPGISAVAEPSASDCTDSSSPHPHSTASESRLRDPTIIITFSHFLPHSGLPYVSSVVKAVGCPGLMPLLDQVGSHLHIHGHSHISCDMQQAGRRYVSHQLMGREGQPSLRCVWQEGCLVSTLLDFEGNVLAD